MKLAIVTVYNTENCGSFWQAVALGKVLKEYGHDVWYLYRDLRETYLIGKSYTLHGRIWYSLKKLGKGQFNAALNFWRRQPNFKKAQKAFEVVRRGSEKYSELDCFVLGSDTLWNFDSPHFMKHRKTYLGLDLAPVRKITYAVSAGNTPYQVFKTEKIYKAAINKLDAISVRDRSTQKIVRELTGRDCPIVCDPTLLLEREQYEMMVEGRKCPSGILLYYYGKIPSEVKTAVQKLKEYLQCPIISFGEYLSWCDANIACDPYDFITCMKNACFVVTNTFHGTVFSVIFRKKFAECGWEKKKIADFLIQIGLADVQIEGNNSLNELYAKKWDYEAIESKLAQLRKNSLSFITGALRDEP